MSIEIREERMASLPEHGRTPISFEVDRIFEVRELNRGLDGLRLRERSVDPWVKDYDAVPGNRPADWAERFDVSRWGLIGAYAEGRRVGGAVIAFGAADVDLLDARTDLALLWDVRVTPDWRSRGVGRRLFAAAEDWARARGCVTLKVETQNVNVGACRFYARQGCVLGAIHRFAYPGLPGEVQLLWYKDLRTEAGSSAPPAGARPVR